jgi:hypothetical protein
MSIDIVRIDKSLQCTSVGMFFWVNTPRLWPAPSISTLSTIIPSIAKPSEGVMSFGTVPATISSGHVIPQAPSVFRFPKPRISIDRLGERSFGEYYESDCIALKKPDIPLVLDPNGVYPAVLCATMIQKFGSRITKSRLSGLFEFGH